ncbi:hypothetical protein [Eoetvoesiella caeni]|uniref:Beta-barrel assembly machine subunit BamE n=1 Tax=Eoetvoesiella caeni TaxID=645616 RepID=A0A366HBW8_9BURK|nr:hypothetical protein [Eoetvoesiella caeni]MCI2809392.1 hypothetical protein [Eoetvoesiella caeni]NYT54533.1 hypothetical protein [Eoetvoesiella caeni]RBP39277.1 hypothetical protein DFR37_10568 [Eoetvoesiella caeni]
MIRFVAVFLVALLVGCASSGVRVTDDQVSKFTKGQTTKTEVIAALGQPTTTMRQSDGTVTVVYNYVESSARPETYIPFVGAFIGGADSRSNMATLRFDANDTLIDYSTAQSQYGTGLGAAAGQVERMPDQPRK